MLRLVLQRMVLLVPILLATLSLVFFMTILIPGDAATYMAGLGSTQEDIEALREDLGLSDPIPVQYTRFVGNALRGDFGRSLHTREPVLDVVLKRLVASIQLALAGLAVATVIGIPIGIISSLKHNSWLDNLLTLIVLVIYSTPAFWLGLLLMLFFSLRLGWFPATGSGGLRNLVLPALALGASSAAILARFMRSSLTQVLGESYIRTARAKGLPGRLILGRHALRNAMIPVVTAAGLQFGILLGRSVVIETVFAYPGIGRLLLLSINTRDLPLLQGGVFFMATGIVLINFVTDLAYTWLDPRIRL